MPPITAAIRLSAILIAACAATEARAVDLPFDAACAGPVQINVGGVYTGITLRKNPVSATTKASTATVVRDSGQVGAQNIVIGAGDSSCFHAVAGAHTYCFQARGTALITNINAVAGTNTYNLPAC